MAATKSLIGLNYPLLLKKEIHTNFNHWPNKILFENLSLISHILSSWWICGFRTLTCPWRRNSLLNLKNLISTRVKCEKFHSNNKEYFSEEKFLISTLLTKVPRRKRILKEVPKQKGWKRNILKREKLTWLKFKGQFFERIFSN